MAIVSDVRGGEYFGQLEELLGQLRDLGVQYDLVYLEASNEALVRRFKETRRRHPLAADGSVIDGIRRERRACSPRCASAPTSDRRHERSVDPSAQGAAQRRSHPARAAAPTSSSPSSRSATSTASRIDADLLFDVRFLPNPYYDLPAPLTGLDAEVRDYVLGSPGVQEFFDRLAALARLPLSRATRPRARRT